MGSAQESLSTAEGLIIEVISTGSLFGAESWTFDRRYWIRSQLETLAERGLLDWDWDPDGNFLVTRTNKLLEHPEYHRVRVNLTSITTSA